MWCVRLGLTNQTIFISMNFIVPFFQQYQNQNYIALANLVFLILLSMTVMLPYCYFGKLATDCFVQMSDCVYEMNWHMLPAKLQKYFILMIGNMQKPIYYHAHYIALLDLNTYIRVRFHNMNRPHDMQMIIIFFSAFKEYIFLLYYV